MQCLEPNNHAADPTAPPHDTTSRPRFGRVRVTVRVRVRVGAVGHHKTLPRHADLGWAASKASVSASETPTSALGNVSGVSGFTCHHTSLAPMHVWLGPDTDTSIVCCRFKDTPQPFTLQEAAPIKESFTSSWTAASQVLGTGPHLCPRVLLPNPVQVIMQHLHPNLENRG